MENTEIMVSVICWAFRHEHFIRDTIEGFLAQQTQFPFEILIHDDASPDGTAAIIREYEAKHPGLVIGVYQTENQYSQGKDFNPMLAAKARGKYIALCEGDDYWTDPLKLQKQVDAMEAHPECAMCVHRTLEVRVDGEPTGTEFPSVPLQSGVLPSYEFLKIGKNYSFHTSSYFFVAEEYRKFVNDPPQFKKECDVGDEVYMLYFGQLADVYYVQDAMSCYRRGVPGSWTRTEREKSVMKRVNHPKKMISTFKSFDAYTGGKYSELCAERIARQLAIVCILEKTCRIFFRKENRVYFAKLSSKQKLFTAFGTVLPGAAKKLYVKRLLEQERQHGI